MKMRKAGGVCGLVLIFTLLCALAVNSPRQKGAQEVTPRYRNASFSIKDRVADLLPRMTLEEKVEQIAGGGESRAELASGTHPRHQVICGERVVRLTPLAMRFRCSVSFMVFSVDCKASVFISRDTG